MNNISSNGEEISSGENHEGSWSRVHSEDGEGLSVNANAAEDVVESQSAFQAPSASVSPGSSLLSPALSKSCTKKCTKCSGAPAGRGVCPGGPLLGAVLSAASVCHFRRSSYWQGSRSRAHALHTGLSSAA